MNILGALSEINSSVESYANSINGCWKGKSGDHICSLARTQILPLISDAMEKVNKLEQAISEASGVRGLISNIQEYNNCIRRLDITDPEGKAMFVYYNGLINECNSKIGEIRENVRQILS